MNVIKSFIKEHTRKDGHKYYTVHIKTRILGFIPSTKNLNLPFTSYPDHFMWMSSGNTFDIPHCFSSLDLAKKQLDKELASIKSSNEEEKNSKIVNTRDIQYP